MSTVPAGRASSSPEAIRSSVDLPQPDGPTTVTNSPPADGERHVVDGLGAVGEHHPDVLEGDAGTGRRGELRAGMRRRQFRHLRPPSARSDPRFLAVSAGGNHG